MTVQLKVCPKCGSHHEKAGKFCSRKCANSRTWSDEDKQKKADAYKTSERWQKHNEQMILQTRKNPEFKDKACEYCGTQLRYYGGKRFCSRTCELSYHEMQRTALENYRLKAQFKFNVYDFPEEFDLELANKHGWYSPKTGNFEGAVRDHMVSVVFGFENQIDPDIISHPANCDLILHRSNVKKHKACSLSLDELYERVKKWNDKYVGVAEIGMRRIANPK